MTQFWFSPLYSFNCYADTVELAEGVKIERIPRGILEYLNSKSFGFYRTYPSESEWIAHVPSLEAEIKPNNTPAERIRAALEIQDKAENMFTDLVNALRLHHGGRILVGPLISATIVDTDYRCGGSLVWTPATNFGFFLEGNDYQLEEADVETLRTLLTNVKRWREEEKLHTIDIALERFHSAYSGPIEDRLINQIIALESLYLEGPQELAYKLALRASCLLTRNKEQRHRIFGTLKKSYRYRSLIVHGNNPPARAELLPISLEIEDYLRQSIIRIMGLLDEGNSLDIIKTKLLDDNILS